VVAGIGLTALVALANACAGTLAPPAAPAAGEIPALEARLTRDSTDDRAIAALAVAYRKAGEPERGLTLLERAASRKEVDAGIPLQLGLGYEEAGRFADALEQYRRYLQVGRSPALLAQVRRRLPLLARKQLIAEAHQALSREAELAATPPQPDAVAVLPFDAGGLDASLQPLGRAMAELLSTDLGQTTRIRVLERVRVQALLDELELDRSGAVDSATAARSGRLLGAGRIVEGLVAGDEAGVRLQAVVVRATDGVSAAALSERDALRALYGAEKRLALGLYRTMGVELTPVEQSRLLAHKVDNLQALVEYGLGLETEDRNDFAGAIRHYDQAVALAPDFVEARAAARRCRVLAAAAAMSPEDLSRMALANWEFDPPAIEGVIAIQSLVPTFLGTRDFFPEVTGSEGIGTQAVLELILHPR
jgi:tetratricopeptide (TPR) repeat protein